MSTLARTLLIPLLAVATGAFAQDAARPCKAQRPQGEPAPQKAKAAAAESPEDFRLRRPTLRAF